MEATRAILKPDVPPLTGRDYAYFRAKGIELLQKLAGESWTDHNTHDPGITILEQLCYALTDLSYRIGLSVPDLLAEGGKQEWTDHFRPGHMLCSGPILLQDWRKVIIDTVGVRNAWIYPMDTTSDTYNARVYYDTVEQSLRMSPPFRTRDSRKTSNPLAMHGLYRVLFLAEPGFNPNFVREQIRQRLQTRRNLCEDFHQIESLSTTALTLEGQIVTTSVSDPADLLARIYFVVQEYLSPRLRFYTLQERIAAGYTTEDILDGPLLEHGFLDDTELNTFQLRHSVRISDIIRLIMKLEGVRAVKSLSLSIAGSSVGASTQDGAPWELWIPDGTAPMLKIPSLTETNTLPPDSIHLLKKGLPLRVPWDVTLSKLKALTQAEKQRTKSTPYNAANLPPVKGRNRNVSSHQSVQHQLPDVYGTGAIGLPQPASLKRIAQSRQLKAYLSLFDQLLANTFAQLGGVARLFSLRPETFRTHYFSRSLQKEIPDFAHLINWQAFGIHSGHSATAKIKEYEAQLQVYAEGGDLSSDLRGTLTEQQHAYDQGGDLEVARQGHWDRRNRLLNHLLARFGEQVTELDKVLKENLFQQKEAMLTTYPALGRQRFQAFDYTQPSMGTNNVSALEQRLALLLGFKNSPKRKLNQLAADDPGGCHLIEHILLRPQEDDQEQETSVYQLPFALDDQQPPLQDPFSFQLTFIFPAWLDRFSEEFNPGFRQSVVKMLREETPAHLRIFIHWLTQAEMVTFEAAYEQWTIHLQTAKE